MEQTRSQIEQAETALGGCIARATGWDASCERSATDLAQALVESGMQRVEMSRRFRGLGLSKRAAKELLSNARRVVRKREKDEWNEQFVGATPLCPHCLQQITDADHFCPKCLGPVTAHASIDPLGRIYATGRAYRQAMSGEPRLVALVAMWLIFGVPLPFLFSEVLGALGAFGPVRWDYVQGMGLFLELAKSVTIYATIALNSAILWKMTTHWVRSRRGER